LTKNSFTPIMRMDESSHSSSSRSLTIVHTPPLSSHCKLYTSEACSSCNFCKYTIM
jgi:hypothetical protein